MGRRKINRVRELIQKSRSNNSKFFEFIPKNVKCSDYPSLQLLRLLPQTTVVRDPFPKRPKNLVLLELNDSRHTSSWSVSSSSPLPVKGSFFRYLSSILSSFYLRPIVGVSDRTDVSPDTYRYTSSYVTRSSETQVFISLFPFLKFLDFSLDRSIKSVKRECFL